MSAPDGGVWSRSTSAISLRTAFSSDIGVCGAGSATWDESSTSTPPTCHVSVSVDSIAPSLLLVFALVAVIGVICLAVLTVVSVRRR